MEIETPPACSQYVTRTSAACIDIRTLFRYLLSHDRNSDTRLFSVRGMLQAGMENSQEKGWCGDTFLLYVYTKLPIHAVHTDTVERQKEPEHGIYWRGLFLLYCPHLSHFCLLH